MTGLPMGSPIVSGKRIRLRRGNLEAFPGGRANMIVRHILNSIVCNFILTIQNFSV